MKSQKQRTSMSLPLAAILNVTAVVEEPAVASVTTGSSDRKLHVVPAGSPASAELQLKAMADGFPLCRNKLFMDANGANVRVTTNSSDVAYTVEVIHEIMEPGWLPSTVDD